VQVQERRKNLKTLIRLSEQRRAKRGVVKSVVAAVAHAIVRATGRRPAAVEEAEHPGRRRRGTHVTTIRCISRHFAPAILGITRRTC